jgi:competence protein ComEC
MFVKIQGEGASAVFTGDAGGIPESVLASRYDWSSQVLHAGHHGSQTSTTDGWLDAVKPKVAVISCGRNNAYGHPHPFVLERLERRNIKTLRTDRDGDIRFDLGPNGFEPRSR